MSVPKYENIITVLWAKGFPFAAWRLPGQKEVKLVIQLSKRLRAFDFNKIETIEGFIVAPFESAENKKVYVLQPDLFFDGLPEINTITELPEFPDKMKTDSMKCEFWDRETYLKKAEQLIRDLKSEKFRKVVLSRVLEKKLQKDFDPGVSFNLLNERYPNSFNYVFYLPELGSWLGATPETLLKINGDEVETVALAGTKPAGKIKWAAKEREEQAIVTEFIQQQLDELQITNYQTQGPETVMAGNVGHLATKFNIPLTELKGKTGEFVSRLHPTPAVCGMPQKEAYQYILQTEDHLRKCYSGFLGPWNLESSSQLFVNLRCAEFDLKKLHLYVGGGLTSSSVAEAEWEETEHKSETLLSVIENL